MRRADARPSRCPARCSAGPSRISRWPASRPRSGTRRRRARRSASRTSPISARASRRRWPTSSADRTARAFALYEERLGNRAQRVLVVAGGVAANQRLKAALEAVARAARLPPGGAAAGALHRQCRHDRLGRGDAAVTRPDRRSGGAGPRPLAARPRRAAGAGRRRQGLGCIGAWISDACPDSGIRRNDDPGDFLYDSPGDEQRTRHGASIGRHRGRGRMGHARSPSPRVGPGATCWSGPMSPRPWPTSISATATRSICPASSLDPAIEATARLNEVANCDFLLMATPAQHVREIAGELAPYLKDEQPLVICAKGIEQASGKLMSQVRGRGRARKPQIAVLSGPSFAAEVGARAARRGDAGQRRGGARPRAVLRAQPSAVPLLLERRRGRRGDRRRGEERLCHRRRHRRRQETRRERPCRAGDPRLCRDGAVRRGARRAPRDADRPVGSRRSGAHLRQPAIAQHVARHRARQRQEPRCRCWASG